MLECGSLKRGAQVCWLKSKKGPVTGIKHTVAASLAPAYKGDAGFCHPYPTTWGGRFLTGPARPGQCNRP